MNNAITTALAIILTVGAIAYDQYRDATWNAEHQHACDTRGC